MLLDALVRGLHRSRTRAPRRLRTRIVVESTGAAPGDEDDGEDEAPRPEARPAATAARRLRTKAKRTSAPGLDDDAAAVAPDAADTETTAAEPRTSRHPRWPGSTLGARPPSAAPPAASRSQPRVGSSPKVINLTGKPALPSAGAPRLPPRSRPGPPLALASSARLRAINPVYGAWLLDLMGSAERIERLQIFESVLEVPTSLLLAGPRPAAGRPHAGSARPGADRPGTDRPRAANPGRHQPRGGGRRPGGLLNRERRFAVRSRRKSDAVRRRLPRGLGDPGPRGLDRGGSGGAVRLGLPQIRQRPGPSKQEGLDLPAPDAADSPVREPSQLTPPNMPDGEWRDELRRPEREPDGKPAAKVDPDESTDEVLASLEAQTSSRRLKNWVRRREPRRRRLSLEEAVQ